MRVAAGAHVDAAEGHLVDVLGPLLLAVPDVGVGVGADVVLVGVLDRARHRDGLQRARARPG